MCCRNAPDDVILILVLPVQSSVLRNVPAVPWHCGHVEQLEFGVGVPSSRT